MKRSKLVLKKIRVTKSRKITDAGSKVLGEPMEIPGVGNMSRSPTPRATA